MKNSKLRKINFLLLGIVGAFFCVACDPEFARLDFTIESQPYDQEITVSNDSIELPAGSAVIVKADPISDGLEEYNSSTDVDFISQDEEVFEIRRGLKSREFVFIGISPGDTNVEIEIDGRVEGRIPVNVTSTPAK